MSPVSLPDHIPTGGLSTYETWGMTPYPVNFPGFQRGPNKIWMCKCFGNCKVLYKSVTVNVVRRSGIEDKF